MIFDEYYPTDENNYEKGGLHTLQSVTKSFASMAIGIAIDQGKINSILPLLQNIDWSNNKDQISLKHMLTMSTGLSGDDNTDYRVVNNYSEYIFSNSMEYLPGTYFEYRTAVSAGQLVKTCR